MVTEKELQVLFNKQYWERYDFVASNTYIDFGCNELDLMGFRRTEYIEEIEIKLSSKCFHADFRKTIKIENQGGINKINKHEALKNGIARPNLFSFLMPKKVAEKCVIPEYAGLYIYCEKEKKIKHVKRPIILHEREFSIEERYFILKKMLRRMWRDSI